MSDDYAKATGAPGFFVHEGISYRVAKFGPRALGDLQAWLKTQVPDPRLMARDLIRDLPDAVALEIWRDLSAEAQNWPPSVFSPAGQELLTTTSDGAAQVVHVLLRQHNPTVDAARARQIADTLSVEDISELMGLAFPERDFRPKGQPDPPTEDRGPVPTIP